MKPRKGSRSARDEALRELNASLTDARRTYAEIEARAGRNGIQGIYGDNERSSQLDRQAGFQAMIVRLEHEIAFLERQVAEEAATSAASGSVERAATA